MLASKNDTRLFLESKKYCPGLKKGNRNHRSDAFSSSRGRKKESGKSGDKNWVEKTPDDIVQHVLLLTKTGGLGLEQENESLSDAGIQYRSHQTPNRNIKTLKNSFEIKAEPFARGPNEMMIKYLVLWTHYQGIEIIKKKQTNDLRIFEKYFLLRL